MSRTGGGRGTNQYGVKGVPVTPQDSSVPESLRRLPMRTATSREFIAADRLEWKLGHIDTSGLRRGGTERSVHRFKLRRTNLIFNDAALEGNTFTEPEVATLLDGSTVGGHTEIEADQIIALSDGADYLIGEIDRGTFSLNKSISDTLHGYIARYEALDSGAFRGERISSDSLTVNVMGDSFRAPRAGEGAENLIRIYDEGLNRVADIDDPLLSAVAYSAFAAYNQFYFDGNKRTSRYMMNGSLMTNGYDAIVTPAARKREYNQALASMYSTGDATQYITFTVSCYDDRL